MEKIVHKYASFEAADQADEDYYRELSGTEKLAILLELIMPENPDEGVVERSARVYPLAQSGEG